MNRKIRIAVATAAIGTLSVLPSVAPAGAQLPGVPELDFSVDRTEGRPGDMVNGHVTPESVAENCNLDVEELQNRFTASFDVLINDIDDVFFEGGVDINDPTTLHVENFEQAAWFATTLTAEQVGLDQALADIAFPQTFVMTFADIATQSPVGERANFDPAVGDATVTVPDLAPGPWAVAATCVSSSTDPEVLAEAVRTNAAIFEEFVTSGGWETATGIPFPEFPITDPTTIIVGMGIVTAQAIGESLVPALVAPDALGFEIFCIQDATGACPGAPGPGAPTPPGQPPAAPPATPVPGRPTFTG